MSQDAKNTEEKKPKAVALLSGGLDSNLAVRMMKEQGVEVEAVAIKTPFCDFDCGKGCGHRVKEVADELDVKLKTVYFGEDYLRMLKNPKQVLRCAQDDNPKIFRLTLLHAPRSVARRGGLGYNSCLPRE